MYEARSCSPLDAVRRVQIQQLEIIDAFLQAALHQDAEVGGEPPREVEARDGAVYTICEKDVMHLLEFRIPVDLK